MTGQSMAVPPGRSALLGARAMPASACRFASRQSPVRPGRARSRVQGCFHARACCSKLVSERRGVQDRRILWMLPKRKTFKALPTLTSLINSHP